LVQLHEEGGTDMADQVYKVTVTIEEVTDPAHAASMSAAQMYHESFFKEAVPGQVVDRMGHGMDRVLAHMILKQADQVIGTITEHEVELSKTLPLP
jgi:hypothetical protein